ncbi:MAG: MaoC family dehydratase N-terminal domain-containing protein [Hyphomicrobiales bacterium]|nr:MaoC family dehydratase N-terminal domain-containing protein [Hyphomicrobiales bacterium]MCP5370901.1 MaoC family dehydratase N-terminal domain-containing protein [Hyphomicrobiales bacterium]
MTPQASTPLDVDHLRGWVGSTEETHELIAAAPLAGLAATLDRDEPMPADGDPVPPGGSWLFFQPRVAMAGLGRDGHPARGGFLPPVPLPRRMFAGGRFEFAAPLRVGVAARRVSTVKTVDAKDGASGPLVFVTVRHEVFDGADFCLSEEHDIVYREDPDPANPPPAPKALPAPGTAVWRRTVHPTPVMLFRYSAVTFNGHRIHYDRDYATGVEGYPGLVFHGPLTATLLMDLCRRERPEATMTGFSFRARRPLFDTADFTIAGEPAADGASARLWALDPEGALAMDATATFAA